MMRAKLVFCLTVVAMMTAQAQMNIDWDENYYLSSLATNGGYAMVSADDGSVYVLSGRHNGTNNDGLVIKYGSSGGQIWAKSISNGGEDYPLGIDIDAAGNIYVCCNVDASGTNQIQCRKYTASGTLSWTESTSGISGATATAMKFSGTGLYVTGYSYSSADDANVLTIKYDTAGSLQWSRSYDQSGSVSNDVEKGLDIDIRSATDEIYVVGTAYIPDSGNVSLLIKYNISGVLQWAKVNNEYPSFWERGESVAVGGLGLNYGIYYTHNVAGRTYLLKYSPTGIKVWKELISDTLQFGKTQCYFLGGDVYVLAYADGAGSTSEGAYLFRYETDGDLKWMRKTGSDFDNSTSSSLLTYSDGYLYSADGFEIKTIDTSNGNILDSFFLVTGVCRMIESRDDGILVTGFNSGGPSAYTALLTVTYGIREGNDNMVHVYPNPSHDGVFVIDNQAGSHLCVLSLSGPVLMQKLMDEEGRINLSAFPDGFYILCLRNEEGLVSYSKVLIQR